MAGAVAVAPAKGPATSPVEHAGQLFRLFGSMFGGDPDLMDTAGKQLKNSLGSTGEKNAAPGDKKLPTSHEITGPTTLYAQGKDALGNKDKGDIDLNDIKQGYLGDCYFLASVGAISHQNPDGIKRLIKENKDKDRNVVSYTVTFKEKDSGFLGTGLFSSGYKDVPITVDAKKFPKDKDGNETHANLPGDTDASGRQEIWPLVMEQAYAQKHGGYEKIGKGGFPADAMSELTGKDSDRKTPGKYASDQLEKDLASGKGVCFSTRGKSFWEKIGGLFGKEAALSNGLVHNHAYTVTGVQTSEDGKKYVLLNNPWGQDHPKPIPFDEIKENFDDIAVNDGIKDL